MAITDDTSDLSSKQSAPSYQALLSGAVTYQFCECANYVVGSHLAMPAISNETHIVKSTLAASD